MMDLRQYKLAEVTVEAPLVGEVRLRELGATALIDVQSRHTDTNGEALSSRAAADLYILLLSKSIIDEEGRRYLDDDAGLETVANLPWETVVSLAEPAMRLNHMLDEKKTD